MSDNDSLKIRVKDPVRDKLKRYEILVAEANSVREDDKLLIKSLFKNFYDKKLSVGIGYQRAFGSVLTGDYFDLMRLPDSNYLFVFADISGHGLPAYTTLIRLRSAITFSIKEAKAEFDRHATISTDRLISTIAHNFTDIMEEVDSCDFACVNFMFINRNDHGYNLKFYNRSMPFPIVIKKTSAGAVEVVNLNKQSDVWKPVKGYMLGKDLRKLLEKQYTATPSCTYHINHGESILFYSDGIFEACNDDDNSMDFGEERIIDIIKENHDLPPQARINILFDAVYEFIGNVENQKDDMTAVLIDFPR